MTAGCGSPSQAGEDWDALVARCVAEGWSGVECLSGIPGLVGSTPIQNVGAYGQDVSQTVAAVRVYDRRTGEVGTARRPSAASPTGTARSSGTRPAHGARP